MAVRQASDGVSARAESRKGRGLGVRLTPQVRAALEQAAHHNLSNVLELALIEWLERSGYQAPRS
jgi:hypothetical protein